MANTRSAADGLPSLTKRSFWRSSRGKRWAFGLGLLAVAIGNMILPSKQGQPARWEDPHV